MARVEMYTTLTCSSCIRAKRLLNGKGATVEEIDVTEDRTGMVARAGGRASVPQIFINDVGIGGFEALVGLERRGELDRLLAEDAPA